MKQEIVNILSGNQGGTDEDRWNDYSVGRLVSFYQKLSEEEKVDFRNSLCLLVEETKEPFSYLLDSARVLEIDIKKSVSKLIRYILSQGYSKHNDRLLAECAYHASLVSPCMLSEILDGVSRFPRTSDMVFRIKERHD